MATSARLSLVPPTLPGVVTAEPEMTRVLGLGLGTTTEAELAQAPLVDDPLFTHVQLSAPATPPTVVILHVPI